MRARSALRPRPEIIPPHVPADRSLLAARLAAQGLSGPPAPSVVEATRRLLAVQAQDPRGARLALRVRSTAASAAEVDHALSTERSLIITWVNRGTLHLIAAEDEPLLHALTTPQLRSASERRLGQEGVSPAALERGVEGLVKALGEDGPMTRQQIRALFERLRVPVAGQALVHILFRATLDGWIVRGPLAGREHAFVLAVDWLGERPKIDRARALAELARRYLVGHAPAGERDLAKWAQISLRDARAGLRAIAGEIVERPDGMVDLRRGLPEPQPAALPPPRLLGPFDPILLGWSSRAFVLDRVEGRTVVTSNGIIKPIALVAGRGAGTWTMPGGRVRLEMWSEPSGRVATALAREASAVERYLATR